MFSGAKRQNKGTVARSPPGWVVVGDDAVLCIEETYVRDKLDLLLKVC